MKVYIENTVKRNIITSMKIVNRFDVVFSQEFLLKKPVDETFNSFFLFESVIMMISIYHKRLNVFIIYFIINYFIQKSIIKKNNIVNS